MTDRTEEAPAPPTPLHIVVSASLFRDPDRPTAPPTVALWCEGFAVDLDVAGLDAVLPRLDDLTARLRDLRTELDADQA